MYATTEYSIAEVLMEASICLELVCTTIIQLYVRVLFICLGKQ
jgi:hypothetical protein